MKTIPSLILALGATFASSGLYGQLVTDPFGTLPTTTYGDAITGDNWLNGAADIDAGADVYESEVYERPVDASFKQRSDGRYSATKYYGYIDIISASVTFNEQFVFFSIEMFNAKEYDNNDTSSTADFKGLGQNYGVRFGEDQYGAGGWFIRADDPYGNVGNGNTWDAKGVSGFLDKTGDVGGPLGTDVPDEEDDMTMDGYETAMIADGKLKEDISGGGSTDDVVAYTRITGARNSVLELAIDYTALGFDDASFLNYLLFEADKGLQDNQNRNWNDKYNKGEAGTPYNDEWGYPDGNIYELDTLRVGFGGEEVIPEPSTYGLIGAAFLGLMMGARRLKARKLARELDAA